MDLSRGIFLLRSGHVEMDLFPGTLPSPFWSSHATDQKFAWMQIVGTLRKLRRQPPVLAIVNYREEAFFRAGTGWASGIGSAARAAFVRPSRLGELLFFASLVRHKVPIALLNRSDVGELPSASDWYYRRCHACFVRELSPQPEITLKSIFTLSGGNPETNRRGRKLLGVLDPLCPVSRDTAKLRPISLGVPEENIAKILFDRRKEYDVFFAGDLHEKGLRGRLVEELRTQAGRRGWRILLRDRLPRDEFFQSLASSHLCLSPPGMGWDCWRHYEAMLAGSVPLMTYPTILQYRPAIEGDHGFYFAPEAGGLTRCLEQALGSPDRLSHVAAAGRNLVLDFHTFPKLRDYVIRETLGASARSPA